MKQFFNGLMVWKSSACHLYTGLTVLYLILYRTAGVQEVPVGYLWSMLLASAIASLIQGVCYSSWIFKKMRYTRRSLLFVALFLPSLSLLAWKANWFPMDEAGAWLIFLGTFFGI